MIVLLEDGDAGICGRRVHLRDRLLARLRASRIDRDLAQGASPEFTVALALRARHLVGPESRRSLARSIENIVADADRFAQRRQLKIPLCRRRIREASIELGEVSERLRSGGPVSARGVAKLELLLADGCGPLYQRGSQEDLRARLREVIEALDPFTA